MAFSAPQTRKLAARVRPQFVKERQVEGKTLHYIEGWYAIAEANRIFGVDAWDRETLSTNCIWQKPVEGRFAAAYVTRVRLTVRVGDNSVVREGFGAGEAMAPTPGQAHERAIKAAETDATKRALSTFGNSFGLSLYRDKQAPPRTTARRPPLPRAYRAKPPEHLRFVASQPCLVCGRTPSQAHHLRYTQPRAVGRKVSDEYTVPLCAFHHDEVHRTGDEYGWWRARGTDAIAVARDLWTRSRDGEIGPAPRETGLPAGAGP